MGVCPIILYVIYMMGQLIDDKYLGLCVCTCLSLVIGQSILFYYTSRDKNEPRLKGLEAHLINFGNRFTVQPSLSHLHLENPVEDADA